MAVNGTRYFEITIDNTKVPSTQTNVPVYVNLGDLTASHSFWNNVASDGSDIRVTEVDGTTEVPFELVSINTASNSGELHFKAPTISGSADTKYRVYYDSSDGAYDPTGSFGRNNVWTDYVAVYHMNTLNDSTANGYNLTANGGTPSTATGKVGTGRSFNNSQYLRNSGFNSLNGSTNRTVQVWVRDTNPTDQYDYAVTFGGTNNDGAGENWQMFMNPGDGRYRFSTKGTARKVTTVSSANTWYHWTARLDGTIFSDTATFLDGVEESYTEFVGGSTTVNTITGDGLLVGSGPLPLSRYWNGRIDEVRLADTAFSDDRILLDYRNQNSPSTFYSLSAEQGGTIPDTEVAFNIDQTNQQSFQRNTFTSSYSFNVAQSSSISNASVATSNESTNIDQTNSITNVLDEIEFIEVPAGRRFIIDNTKVTGSHVNIPILLDLSDVPSSSDFWNNAGADGGNIRAYTGSIELPLEIKNIDTGSYTGQVYINTSGSLQSDVDTVYDLINDGNGLYSASDPYGRNNVWKDYHAVWHLEEDPTGTNIDSTGNYDLSNAGNLVSGDLVSGQIGNGINFDGNATDGLVNSSWDAVTGSSVEFSVTVWINPDASWPQYANILNFGSVSSNANYFQLIRQTTADNFRIGMGSAAQEQVTAATMDTGVWQNWAFTFSGSQFNSTNAQAYKNGNNTSLSGDTGTFTLNSGTFEIGYSTRHELDREWIGLIDEVRVGKTKFSANRILTEYNNTSDPSTFYSTQEASSSIPAIIKRFELNHTSSVTPTEEIFVNQTLNFPLNNKLKLNRYRGDKYFEVVITGSKVPATVTDVPILLDLADLPTDHPFWDNVQPDGGDIRPCEEDKTLLAHEIVNISTGSKTGQVWFKARTLSGSQDNTFRIYYQNPSASKLPKTDPHGQYAVWSDYDAVWHFRNLSDSTENQRDLSFNNMDSSNNVDSVIGKGYEFNGTNESLERASSDIGFGTGSRSFTGWIDMYPAASQSVSFPYLISYGNTGVNTEVYNFFHDSSNGLRIAINGGFTRIWDTDIKGTGPRYIGLVADGNEIVDHTLYIDGAADTIFSTNNGALNIGSGKLAIARDNGTSNRFAAGKFDEIRVATTALSQPRLETEYNNQVDTTAFYSLGDEISQIALEVNLNFRHTSSISPTVENQLNGALTLDQIETIAAEAGIPLDISFSLTQSGSLSFVRDVEVDKAFSFSQTNQLNAGVDISVGSTLSFTQNNTIAKSVESTTDRSFAIDQSSSIANSISGVVDRSLSFNQTTQITPDQKYIIARSLTLSNNNTILTASDATSEESLDFDQSSSVSPTGTATLDQEIFISAVSSLTKSGEWVANPSLAQALTTAISPDFEVNIFEVAFSVDNTTDIDNPETVDVLHDFTLGAQNQLSIVMNAIAASAIDVDSVSNINIQGNVATVTLSDGRTLTIAFENRTKTIDKDDRTLYM